MSRYIQSDYNKLLTYLENYSLKTVLTDDEFQRNAKCIHRKLLSILIMINELEAQKVFDDVERKYFTEIGSDLIQAFFCWANGAYKPAELQLRSGIENYIKALVYKEKTTILMIKNVYEVFDEAASSKVFDNEVCKKHFDTLHNEYSNLCAFVHGAIHSLFQIGAMISLPEYNSKLASEFCNNFQRTVNSMLSVLYYNYFANVFKMHDENREIFLQGLLKADKAEIYYAKTED